MRRGLLLVMALVALGTAIAPASAQESPCYDLPLESLSRWPGGNPRVRALELEGRRVLVLVPPGYDSSTARYPVIYLMQGGGHSPDATFLMNTDLIEFTERPDMPPAIVVMPDGTPAPFWLDWRNRKILDETFFVSTLVPAIDREFRTRGGRAHRAIAGISAGGFGALHLAARHPDLFAAAGGLDAVADLDELDPYYNNVFLATAVVRSSCETGGPDPLGMLGDPVVDRLWWANASPAALAPNFGGMSLDVYVRNGVPHDAEDVIDYVSYWHASQSAFVFPSNERFHAALVRAGVRHSYASGPGIHTFRYFQQQIHDWWGSLFTTGFGSAAPASFDYRTADPIFSVWGWTFTADDQRAAEFLDVADASCNGIGLTGSGTTTVTTGPCFAPGQSVALMGAIEQETRATPEGRIRFSVDLGPPHAIQQFTATARALEALGGYWASRSVTFGTTD